MTKNTDYRSLKSKDNYKKIKRLIDFFIALPLTIILLPVMILLALLIYKEDGRPAIFSQTRTGMANKPFTIYKFRTMEVNNESAKDSSSAKYNFNGDKVPDDFVFKSSSSSRVTKVGEFLRKTSLDELPQLFNVLIGDMSLVGPRPEIPEITEQYNSRQKIRLSVRPGITGLAQVNGRSDINHGEKIEYDLEYVRNRSLWLDFKILVRTVVNAVKGEGAY